MSNAEKLLNAIEKHATAAINETAYVPPAMTPARLGGIKRKARATKAEVKLEKAIADLRQIIATG